MNDIFEPQCNFDEIVCIAPGPSLTEEQCQTVMEAGKFTIAIGNAGRYAPYADILYHCDRKWWEYHRGAPYFYGDAKVSLEAVGKQYPEIRRVLQSGRSTGYDNAPYVVTGRNSGYQAINLALHFKPKKIILLGYDMQDKDGKHNIDGDHPPGLKRRFSPEQYMPFYTSLADTLEEECIAVYNCTLNTALTCFEQRELKDVL